ncbi:MAG TPA: hypothetical protein VMS09_05080 [Paenibacillus sp.]|uniref:hypothetical protein n=1 Tax=Paenibacillus sp. TaxID=58172 RepID=UPI002BF6D781|nr:hypothetical protein [Paenibacillus sp.]HUC91391.1 hypothetical protein [Paenibacillus sp.]
MYVDQLRLRRSFAFVRVWGSEEDHDLKRYTGVSPREYRRRCGHLLRDEPVVMTLI